MSFLQAGFWGFLCILLAVYYFMPKKKYQWVILLIGSYVFYLYAGVKTSIYILLTTLTTWYGALLITKISEKKKANLKITEDKQEKKNIKKIAKSRQRKVFWCILLFNFGILAFLKYFNFLMINIASLMSITSGNYIKPLSLGLMLPLGISFYTFQSMGYLIDVYNGKYSAETNLFKFALFVSFFPQVIEGPINRFDKIASDLYKEKKFDITRVEYALQLILWGLFKKIVIADRAILVVNKVFDNYNDYGGAIIVFGILFYSLQQYADFSGGIDMAIGIAELFGIKMSKNFKRPYFSVSLAEFWRRWHITLGTWMRDYIFYPLALTKTISKIGRVTKKRFGKNVAKIPTVGFANIVVFLVVGIWHGPYWHYVAWGLYNGLIIASSAVLEPIYEKLKKFTKVNTKCFSYKLFMILRTFFIVNIGWYFDRGNSIRASFNMMYITITKFNLGQILNGTILSLGLNKIDFIILLFATLILFTVSVMQENNIKIRIFLSEQNLVFRWAVLYGFIFITVALAYASKDSSGGFMYAQF
ncbi:MBOAT family O-acyltransferase [Clostridium sp. BJN0001]|uniref:MBOAT family O-acyltransferase n=1 Tax=Clostridium sp. BJN0001 TaxID=2930219 RepID=UPI001FD35EFC|nr:MBOAT family O-acyltransferase [Clostridium sp. BJN0001]